MNPLRVHNKEIDVSNRKLLIGPNCTIVFERDYPLEPNGDDLNLSLVFDHYDKETKKIKLEQYNNLENTVYLKIFGHERIYGRRLEHTSSHETESTAVYVLNVRLQPGQIVDFKDSKNKLSIGIAHDLYPYEITITDELRTELVKDFS